MAVEKVLLLHGPVISYGSFPIITLIGNSGREAPMATYNCEHNILTQAWVFRQHGYKIAYSGWSDDDEWLEANRDLFDYLVTSDQNLLHKDSTYFGEVILNNKEKLYYASLQGLRLIRANLGDDAMVFRLRSDVAVSPDHAITEMNRLVRHSRDILIEHCDMQKMFSMPDFIMMGEVAVLEAIYESLYTRSRDGTAYHVSSHIDHSFTCLSLQEQGMLGRIICMSRNIFDSMVWRGLPRYLEHVTGTFAKQFFFDGILTRNPNIKADELAALMISPGMSGREDRTPGSETSPPAT